MIAAMDAAGGGDTITAESRDTPADANATSIIESDDTSGNPNAKTVANSKDIDIGSSTNVIAGSEEPAENREIIPESKGTVLDSNIASPAEPNDITEDYNANIVGEPEDTAGVADVEAVTETKDTVEDTVVEVVTETKDTVGDTEVEVVTERKDTVGPSNSVANSKDADVETSELGEAAKDVVTEGNDHTRESDNRKYNIINFSPHWQ